MPSGYNIENILWADEDKVIKQQQQASYWVCCDVT